MCTYRDLWGKEWCKIKENWKVTKIAVSIYAVLSCDRSVKAPANSQKSTCSMAAFKTFLTFSKYLIFLLFFFPNLISGGCFFSTITAWCEFLVP